MASSSNIFASNVFYSGNVFGPSGEQLTQGAALTQKIQDLAGGFSNGAPGIITSTSITGAGVVQSTLSPFTNALEGSIYFPGTSSNYISTVNPIFDQAWNTRQFTLEGWFYLTTFSGLGSGISLIGHTAINGANNWFMGVNSSGTFLFYYFKGTDTYVYSTTNLNINTWYHLCVQSDGTNVYLFINGTLSQTAAVSGTPAITAGLPLNIGINNGGAFPAFYISSPRLAFAANLYSQGSFTAPTGPLGPAPTGQTVMLLRNPLYSSMTLKNPLNAQSSVRVRCLPSDALIYLDAFGSNVPNKGPMSNSPTFDPYGTGGVNFVAASSQYLEFGPQTFTLGSKGFTAVVKFQNSGAPNNYERIFEFGNDYVNTAGCNSLALWRESKVLAFYVYWNNSATNTYASTSAVIIQNQVYVVAMRYDPMAQIISLWINGTLVSVSGTTTPANASDRLLKFCHVGADVAGTAGAVQQVRCMNGTIYTFAAYNRALTDTEITDASAMLNQVTPVVPRTVEIGNVNGRPALTVDPTGAVNVLGPLNGAPGGYAPVDLGINSLSLALSNSTSNISVTSFSPLGSSEGSLYFPYGVANSNNFIVLGSSSIPFVNSNIYSSDFLMEMWVNPVTLQSSPFVAYGLTTIGACDWGLGLNGTSGQLGWYNNIGGTGTWVYSPTGAVSSNTWQHVAVIFQFATRRAQILVNGQPQVLSGTGAVTTAGTVATYSTSIPANTGNYLTIGQNGFFGSSVPYNGYITNIRIVTGSGAGQIYNNNSFVPITSPLFPASNISGGSMTTRLLVRVPRAPGQVQIQKLMGAAATGFSGVQAFPPAPMTTYLTNLTGLAPYGQGTYVASASNEFDSSGNALWRAFDKNTSTVWTGDGSSYTSGNYTKSPPVTTVDVNGTSYTGEWIQLQMPSSIVLSNYQINSPGSQGPSLFYLLGSRDGTNWFLVDSRSGQIPNSTYLTYPVSSGQAFTYFRLVTNKIYGGNSYVQILELVFNGTIEGPNVTADGRLGVGVSNPVQALEVAGNMVCGGTVSSGTGLMFRNALYNGDFRIAQRGASLSFNGFNLDRWWVSTSGSTGSPTGTVSQIQSGLANFSNALQLQSTYTSAGNYWLSQSLETRDVVRFQGQPVTVSFWYRIPTNFTGSWTAYLVWSTATDTKLIDSSVTYTVAGSLVLTNTTAWTYASFTTFVPPTATALAVQFVTTGSTVNGATFQLTGVQLEKGTVATPFEVRPYATELALCQRYYQKTYNMGSPPGTNVTGVGAIIVTAPNSTVVPGAQFRTTMRAAPTIVMYNPYSTTSGVIGLLSTGADTGTATAEVSTTSDSGFRYAAVTVTSGVIYQYHYTANAEL